MLKSIFVLFYCLAIISCTPISHPPIVLHTPQAKIIKHNRVPTKLLKSGQTIKLLVWNIYKQNRVPLIPDLQGFSSRTDIMILQEIYLTKSFDKKLQQPPFNSHHFITAPSFNYRGWPTGVSTASQFKYEAAFFKRSPVLEPLLNSPKTSLFVTFPIEGQNKKLMVANIHGINFVGQKKFSKHMQQIFETLKTHHGPIVLAGDFNTRNKQRFHLVKTWAQKQGLGLVKLKKDNRGTPLDLVLTRGIKVISASLLPEINSSDHPPMVLHLQWPPPVPSL